jgi:hypothetical protein
MARPVRLATSCEGWRQGVMERFKFADLWEAAYTAAMSKGPGPRTIYDALIVGSGASGGWVAKGLTEAPEGCWWRV